MAVTWTLGLDKTDHKTFFTTKLSLWHQGVRISRTIFMPFKYSIVRPLELSPLRPRRRFGGGFIKLAATSRLHIHPIRASNKGRPSPRRELMNRFLLNLRRGSFLYWITFRGRFKGGGAIWAGLSWQTRWAAIWYRGGRLRKYLALEIWEKMNDAIVPKFRYHVIMM